MATDDRCSACLAPAGNSFDKGGFTYLVCSSCGSAWLNPVPDRVAALYDRDYFVGGRHGGYADYGADGNLHRRNADRRIDASGAVPPGLVVDVGCAYGFALDAAVERGFAANGVDVSAHARAEAERKGHRVLDSLDAVADGSASLVLFTQVLEHMPDPVGALGDAHRMARPNGTILIETWDRSSVAARMLGTRWHQVTPPSVLHLWTGEGIRRLTARAGLRDVSIRRWTKHVSIGWAGGIAADKSAAGRALDRTARAVRLDRVTIRYSIGDLVLVTARRG